VRHVLCHTVPRPAVRTHPTHSDQPEKDRPGRSSQTVSATPGPGSSLNWILGQKSRPYRPCSLALCYPRAVESTLPGFQADLIDDPRFLVWHYTDLQGLLGIVETQELWATRMSALNDTSELSHGIDGLKQEFEVWSRKCTHSADTLAALRDHLERLEEHGAQDNIYVLCASTEGDSLQMWMHYARNGVAIGMPSAALNLAQQGTTKIHLAFPLSGGLSSTETGTVFPYRGPVFYQADENRQATACCAFEAAATSISNGFPSSSVDVQVALTTAAGGLKHPAFRGESEYRWIVSGRPSDEDAQADCRVNAGGVVPYIRLVNTRTPDGLADTDLKTPLPISKVVIAPPADDARVSAVTALLHDRGYPNAQVERSAIPLR